jgi:hypothetical protein
VSWFSRDVVESVSKDFVERNLRANKMYGWAATEDLNGIGISESSGSFW